MKKLPFSYFVKQTIFNEKIKSKPLCKWFKQDIICQSVFKLEYFESLFNKVKNIYHFSNLKLTQICNEFPVNWKVRLNLLNGIHRKDLLIFNTDYSQIQLYEAISFLLNDVLQIPHQFQTELKQEIIKTLLTHNSSGCYFTITGIQNYGIMFLNNKKITIDIFVHQFIHYYQDVTGKDVSQFNINFKQFEIPKNLNLFLDYTSENELHNYLNIITGKNQLIPYTNNLLFQLKKFYKNINLKQFREHFNLLCQQTSDKTSQQYINRVYKSDFCTWLLNSNQNLIPFVLFILCNIYQKNLVTFRNHILSSF